MPKTFAQDFCLGPRDTLEIKYSNVAPKLHAIPEPTKLQKPCHRETLCDRWLACPHTSKYSCGNQRAFVLINYYILHQEFPKAQDKSLGRRSWALPKTCNFRSWALSWAQGTKNDKSTLTTFFSGLVPKTNDTPLERFNNLNYLETWFMPGCPPWPLVVWLLELWCKGCFAKLFNSFCMEPT